MSATAALIPNRLGTADLARVASVGLRTRRLRAALSALGIAIGVAAIVAVLGFSSSSQAGLLATAFLVTYFLTSPVFGALGDRVSRTRLMSIGVAAWSAATQSGHGRPGRVDRCPGRRPPRPARGAGRRRR